MSESDVNLAIADLMNPAPDNRAEPKPVPTPSPSAPGVGPYAASTGPGPTGAEQAPLNWTVSEEWKSPASQFPQNTATPGFNIPSELNSFQSRYEPAGVTDNRNAGEFPLAEHGNGAPSQVERAEAIQPRSEQVQPAQAAVAQTEVASVTTSAVQDIQHYIRMGSILCTLLIVVVGGWAALTSISGAIVSSATVVVEGNAHNVQHLDGGIVSEILVREGQLVETGAEVARLDNTKAVSRVEFLEAQIASLTSQIDLIGEELKGLNQLLEKGLARKSQVLSVKRRQAELIGQRNESRAQIKAARDDAERSVVRAPITGTVHQLNTEKIGTVLQAGESIMLLVPKENKLVLEARLEPRNIDQVRVGQNAVVRFPSFDARTTPELNGSVSLVSADLEKESADTPAFFKLLIELSGDEIARLGGKTLRPGMPAEVFIQTNQRTVLNYLLKPLSDQINRTFREE